MKDWYHSAGIYRDILDQILFRDPPNAISHTETTNGTTCITEEVIFVDGSRLYISAQVPLPPMADMTPRQVIYMKASGEKGKRMDDGTHEAIDLARESIAVRLMEVVSELLDTLPEREKIVCPDCNGEKICQTCRGQGCDRCGNSGKCLECNGRGVVIE